MMRPHLVCLVLLQTAGAALLPSTGGIPQPLIDDWASEEPPRLPLNAIVLEERDELVWSDETLEFNGLAADPRTPRPLTAHLESFRLPNGVCCHAFDGAGQPLSTFPWTSEASLVPDRARAMLILQLLDAVEYLHSRGSAYLGLDAEVVRVVPRESDAADCELRLLGFGAAVRLQSAGRTTANVERRSTYMLDSETPFHAPELLSSAVLQSNLRSLFQIDSWSVGVLITMIAGGSNESPFRADVDWKAGLLTPEAATRARIVQMRRAYGEFITELDAGAGGFLFRHGWVLRLILGLLQPEPSDRMTIYQARAVALEALERNPEYAEAVRAYLGAEDGATAAEGADAADGGAAAPSALAAATATASATAIATTTTTAAAATTTVKTSSSRPPPFSSSPRTNQKPPQKPQQKPPPARQPPAQRADLPAEVGELTRFRKLGARDGSGEPFRSLEAMLNMGSRGSAYVQIEKRAEWSGVLNYGEVIGFRNRSDGDRWDVFVPGIDGALPQYEPFKLVGVLGVMLIKGGNHKLCVELEGRPPVSRERVNADIAKFKEVYAQVHPKTQASRIRFLALDEFEF